ncbi:toprim domain-containing protein [Kribbella sp. CA-293567]|uniref:toprim domain-containing protein n=1 Tax=Kribbella sp. CA-293567 TaxID=3002436 RepID=UPI0022DD486C|nr:toprim domain-containing protein [Kribbella sp. CA-293567]WBQ04410.1 toprim domain-containing protein [Kribbella sp. CA-293567]
MDRLFRVHEAATAFYRAQLQSNCRTWAARLLVDRHLGAVLSSDSTWSVGYAPTGWSRLVDHLRSAGFDDDSMVAAGLAKPIRSGYLVDRLHDRLTFVAHDIDLRPVGFVARARAGEPKYLGSPTTRIYAKRRSLVGLDAQRDRLARGAVPVVVEGPTDAVAVSLVGDEWAGAATCGTAITAEQAAIVRRHTVGDTVIVMLDGDPGGQRSTERGLDVLAAEFRSVLVAELPSGDDPASLFRSAPGVLRATLTHARSGVEFAIDVELARWGKVLDHVSGQVGALRAVAPLVVRLPHEQIAGQVARLARQLHLEERVVSREILASVDRRGSSGATASDLETDPELDSRSP